MKVGEIENGKAACILIDCQYAYLHYPRPGDESNPDAICNCIALDSYEENSSISNAVFEAANYLGIPESEIEISYA